MVALWPLLTPNTTPSLVIQPEEVLECLKCEDKKHFLERCPLQELGVAEEKKGRNWEKNQRQGVGRHSWGGLPETGMLRS